ncbi:unnamed protein product [Cylicocyclus nassatus]|uniref:NAB co-repressor domain-containing protein n=1 Tax=Cylicocyclus nassatus TaxID=53992 RepID=A0AA36GSX3_CYLNA|nr:unnamed protein product [Cylicocyclus nassatus]
MVNYRAVSTYVVQLCFSRRKLRVPGRLFQVLLYATRQFCPTRRFVAFPTAQWRYVKKSHDFHQILYKIKSEFQSGKVLDLLSTSADTLNRLAEYRKYSAIYGRFDAKSKPDKGLSFHEVSVNEAAAQLCLIMPSLLTTRDELFPLARQVVKDAGYHKAKASPHVLVRIMTQKLTCFQQQSNQKRRERSLKVTTLPSDAFSELRKQSLLLMREPLSTLRKNVKEKITEKCHVALNDYELKTNDEKEIEHGDFLRFGSEFLRIHAVSFCVKDAARKGNLVESINVKNNAVQTEHICMQICNKCLSCGLRFCEHICHVGQCPRCFQTQYILAEVIASGGRLSETLDHVSYINQSEISEHILASVNDAIKSFSNNITVTNYDLMRYLNGQLKKYYHEGRWEIPQLANLAEADYLQSGSYFSPGKVPTSDSEAAPELEETDPALLDKYFIVQGKKLLELFNLSRCGCSNGTEPGDVCLEVHASAAIPIIKYVTKGPKPEVKKWEGQEKLVEDVHKKLYSGTTLACAAAITTGARWTKLNNWASEMNLLLPCSTTFYKNFRRIIPSIETVYDKHEAQTIVRIKNAYENEVQPGWNIAIDGAYDSRGHSADFCKVLAIDLKTGLCVHTEVVHRSETGGKSGRMEKAGFHRILRWFRSMNIPIHSISTDRSYAFKTEIESYNAEYGDQVGKRKDCEAIHDWKDHIKAHLYHSIKQGAQNNSGEVVRHYFNTCIYHVADIHRWPQNTLTGDITHCDHQGLLPEDRENVTWGSLAHDKLKEVILQDAFQKDIALASPYGGTSQCESKNSLDRIYGPKEVYLPSSTYSLYAKLSSLHKNALRIAELDGERVVQRVTVVHRKFSERESHIERKTPVEHIWRKEIWIDFLSHYNERTTNEQDMEYEELVT